MEQLLSAIASDLMSRALNLVIQKYIGSNAEDAPHKLLRLQHVLLRIDATVKEAEGRQITNQAMLTQLELLRQGMYGGHYMLDTFRCRGRGGDDEVSRGGRSVALPRFRAAKRLLFFPVKNNADKLQNTMLDSTSVKKLEKMLQNLEMMISNMEEFTMFLEGYSRICQQPYNTYLILDKVMFGRQMEKETVINFVLQPEAAGDGNPGVLPIVGATRVGKSTLVEHVCLDERVRRHFSLIIFTADDLDARNMAALRESGVIKHEDLTAASQGRSLLVTELTRDMQEETWRTLYSAAKSMGHGSKIIITSRSENIIASGTTQALRFKPLSQEAFWYFFKAIAFGSASPDDEPKLKSLGMEIAMLLDRQIMRANRLASLLRTNYNARFWLRLLQCLRDYTNKHVSTYGEHPSILISKNQPVYLWSMVKNQTDVVICNVYQKPSPYHGVPKLSVQEFITERVITHGKFDMVLWRSSIPPYNAYIVSCVVENARCPVTSNKKRGRHARI